MSAIGQYSEASYSDTLHIRVTNVGGGGGSEGSGSSLDFVKKFERKFNSFFTIVFYSLVQIV